MQSARAGGFVIPLDVRGEWFRFPYLFSDLLATELRRTRADEIPGLHLAAAQWFAAHGYVLEAINHSVAADDRDLMASLLVERYFTLMLDGHLASVRSLVDAAVSRSPTAELALVVAADELIGGSLERATAQLALAEQRAGDVPEDRRPRFEMLLYVTRLPWPHGSAISSPCWMLLSRPSSSPNHCPTRTLPCRPMSGP
jgi:LuxR family maltose regulon positive regulatory protein